MKSLLIAASLLIGLKAHAGYDANELLRWLPMGTTTGTDLNGKACKLNVDTLLNSTSARIYLEGVELHLIPRFNTYMSNELKEIKETSSSIIITVESRKSNSYTPARRQTIKVVKTSKGTEVSITEKEVRLFGKTFEAACTIN